MLILFLRQIFHFLPVRHPLSKDTIFDGEKKDILRTCAVQTMIYLFLFLSRKTFEVSLVSEHFPVFLHENRKQWNRKIIIFMNDINKIIGKALKKNEFDQRYSVAQISIGPNVNV